jgi:uncharacterized protein (DUF342 family)
LGLVFCTKTQRVFKGGEEHMLQELTPHLRFAKAIARDRSRPWRRCGRAWLAGHRPDTPLEQVSIQAQPYTLRLADDEMEAWICFTTDVPVSLKQLQQDLAAAGIVSGIDHFLLQDLAEAHQPGEHYRIAQGIPPEDGLEYFFSRRREQAPKRLPNGQVDFYNLETIQNVVQQQILIAKIPPHASQPGKTVTGKLLPPAAQEVPLPQAGRNVARSEDGQALSALVNGYPVLSDNVLSVETTYTLEGDVDFSVGNITCVGNVVVTGDVKSGFSIKCAQDVVTHGVVDAATIDAGGTVYLYGNVFGRQKGYIRSAADVQGIYVDATTIEACKDIVLRHGARNSQLRAGRSVLIQGSGHLRGGTVQAYERILSHDLGSASGVATRVEILPGAFDEGIQSRFLQHLEAMLKEDSAWLEEHRNLDLTPEHMQVMRNTLCHSQTAVQTLSTYFQQRRQLRTSTPLHVGTIVATGTVYPGVTLCIGGVLLSITRPLTGVMFAKVEGTIHVKTLALHEEHCARLTPQQWLCDRTETTHGRLG